jgi:BioD-like phosphotransacetylase family protein
MVARRRQSSQKAVRERAAEKGRVKLDASVERRLANLSSMLTDLQRTLEIQSKRTAAIQAQMDHLDARVRGRS